MKLVEVRRVDKELALHLLELDPDKKYIFFCRGIARGEGREKIREQLSLFGEVIFFTENTELRVTEDVTVEIKP